MREIFSENNASILLMSPKIFNKSLKMLIKKTSLLKSMSKIYKISSNKTETNNVKNNFNRKMKFIKIFNKVVKI